MDPAEGEVAQLEVRPEKKRRMDGEPLPTQAMAVTKVLEDDNLLREIIVRVGFPTALVRAALVCKRWLGHVSHPKFLSRFRKLHLPRLLGYYSTEGVVSQGLYSPRFVPMSPQPPELATVIRRLESYKFDTLGISDHTLENEGAANVQIDEVGDNGQFAILLMGRCIFYLDIKCRTLCKVYDDKGNDQAYGSIHPFMMTWLPTFPALKDDPARNAM